MSEYKKTGLSNLPTSEQIYSPEKYFLNERYEEVEISTLQIPNYQIIDEGTLGSLDLVYLMQDTIGPRNAITAAVGIGGGSWKDYIDNSENLIMTVKISGDTPQDLNEIYDAFILWGDTQKRFTEVVEQYNGVIYKGTTNVWISKQNGFVKLVLSQDISVIDEISPQLGDL